MSTNLIQAIIVRDEKIKHILNSYNVASGKKRKRENEEKEDEITRLFKELEELQNEPVQEMFNKEDVIYLEDKLKLIKSEEGDDREWRNMHLQSQYLEAFRYLEKADQILKTLPPLPLSSLKKEMTNYVTKSREIVFRSRLEKVARVAELRNNMIDVYRPYWTYSKDMNPMKGPPPAPWTLVRTIDENVKVCKTLFEFKLLIRGRLRDFLNPDYSFTDIDGLWTVYPECDVKVVKPNVYETLYFRFSLDDDTPEMKPPMKLKGFAGLTVFEKGIIETKRKMIVDLKGDLIKQLKRHLTHPRECIKFVDGVAYGDSIERKAMFKVTEDILKLHGFPLLDLRNPSGEITDEEAADWKLLGMVFTRCLHRRFRLAWPLPQSFFYSDPLDPEFFPKTKTFPTRELEHPPIPINHFLWPEGPVIPGPRDDRLMCFMKDKWLTHIKLRQKAFFLGCQASTDTICDSLFLHELIDREDILMRIQFLDVEEVFFITINCYKKQFIVIKFYFF